MNNFKLFDSLLRKCSWYASSIINNNINWIWLELPIAIFSDNVTGFSATILVLLSHFVSINFFFWRSFFSFFFPPGLFHLSAWFLSLSLFWHVWALHSLESLNLLCHLPFFFFFWIPVFFFWYFLDAVIAGYCE